MAVQTAITVEEYLQTGYQPDCEYLDGNVVERNMGERSHSLTQTQIIVALSAQARARRVLVFTEQRVQVGPTRYRVPDICVMRADAPGEEILTTPPLLCVEILSRNDAMSEVVEKVNEYLRFGVPCVWVVDPWRRWAYIYTETGPREVKDGILRCADPDLMVTLADAFATLGKAPEV